MTWDTFLTLRGTKGMYLDYVGTLRPSKSYGWGGGVGWVAHKILVTSPEAKFLFSFLGLLGPGLWTGTWPRACQQGDLKEGETGCSTELKSEHA